MNTKDLMDADYPIPDPAWEYAEIWHQCQAIRTELEMLLGELATYEEANPEYDQLIGERVDTLAYLAQRASLVGTKVETSRD